MSVAPAVIMAHDEPTRREFLALGALGALRGLWNGQSNALAVGLLLLAAACLARRQGWGAACLLAGADWLKLTPLALAQDLRAFHQKQGYYPRTVCVHINYKHDPQIRRELAQLATELQADILPAHEGMVIEL